MKMRSLINTTSDLSGYPITNAPIEHGVLVYENGTFRYEYIAPGGGVTIVQSVGAGASIIKSLISNVLTLKSLKGFDQNIQVNALTDEINFALNSNLNFSQDQTFHLDDGGSGTLLNLIFRTTFGIFSSIPLQINNQSRIDINGISYFNSVLDGTPASNKFLALDSNNKLITSTVTDATTAVNTPLPGNGIFIGKVGDTLEFRTFVDGLNFNTGISAGSFLFNVNQNLQEIVTINGNAPRTPGYGTFNPNNEILHIGASKIYFDNVDYLDPAPLMGIAQDGQLIKTYAVDTLLDTNGNYGLSAGVINNIARVKTLIAGRNIGITASPQDLTLDLAVNLENIFTINSLTPFPLTIYNEEINFPAIPAQPWNNTRQNLWINSTHEICRGYSCNTVTNAGINTLISDDTIATNGNIALKGLVAGSNITISTTASDIIINSTASGGNIYNSDGQSTDDQRVFNGKTPGSLNNKLVFNSVNLNLTNHLPYDIEYSGTQATDAMLCFNQGGTYSKFVMAPYNYLSTICYFTMQPTYGYRRQFYQSYATTITGNMEWIFEVEVYERTVGLPQAFCASYQFTCNAQLTNATYYIKPSRTSLLNGSSPQNVVGLEIYQTTSGPNPVWVLCLVSLGIGLTGTPTDYMVHVKDKGPSTGKYNGTLLGASIITPSQNYLENFQFLYYSGLGPWPNTLAYYNRVGCDLRITVMGQVQNNNSNTVGTLAVRMNGVAIYVINTRTGQGNSTVPVHGTKTIKFVELLNLGAISLNNPITVSFFGTGAGSNFSAMPFVLDMQYV